MPLLPHPLQKTLKVFIRIPALIPRKVTNDLKMFFINTKSINFKGECPLRQKIIFVHALHKYRIINAILIVYFLSIKF